MTIQDEFTSLPVSSKQKHLKRKQRDGLCVYGGCRERRVDGQHCPAHAANLRMRVRKHYYVNRGTPEEKHVRAVAKDMGEKLMAAMLVHKFTKA